MRASAFCFSSLVKHTSLKLSHKYLLGAKTWDTDVSSTVCTVQSLISHFRERSKPISIWKKLSIWTCASNHVLQWINFGCVDDLVTNSKTDIYAFWATSAVSCLHLLTANDVTSASFRLETVISFSWQKEALYHRLCSEMRHNHTWTACSWFAFLRETSWHLET